MEVKYICELIQIKDILKAWQRKSPKLIQNIILAYKKWTFQITEKENRYILPYSTLEIKQLKTLQKRLHKKLKKEDIKYIVLSKYLAKFSEIRNTIYSEQKEILQGRKIFLYLVEDSIQYIADCSNQKLENMTIAILVNESKKEYNDLIMKLAQKVKRLTIVTNNSNRFKKLESYLYDELGILITLSNNKKKALSKSTVIINLDFPEELVNRFSINRKGIFLHLEEKIQIQTKSFKGVNINFYDIEVNGQYEGILKKYEAFDQGAIYESILYRENRQNKIPESIKQDEVHIIKLIGNNGVIRQEEYSRVLSMQKAEKS